MTSTFPRRQPKYQHFKPRNLAKVRIDGRDIYLGKYESPESWQKYQRVLAEWRLGKFSAEAARADITICELIAAYVRHAAEYYVKNGVRTREYGCIREACRPLREPYEEELAAEFGPQALQIVQRKMIEIGWSRKHINKQVSRLVRMFKWAVSQQMIHPEVHQAIAAVPGLKQGRTEARETEPVRAIDDSVVEATLPELGPIVADMVRIQRLTGCRPSEVCLIRPMDIDRSVEIWRYRPSSHKMEHHYRQRIIPIGPRAQQLLTKYLLRPDLTRVRHRGLARTRVSGTPRTLTGVP